MKRLLATIDRAAEHMEKAGHCALAAVLDSVSEEMAKRNVLIRGIYQDYTSWSRVSAGKLEHVAQYVKAMPQALEAARTA